MKFKNVVKKLKEVDYGAFFGSKAFLIGGCLVIIAAAIVVNALLPANTDKKTDGGNQILGNSVLVGGEAENEEATDYFTQAVIDRENTRNEAMDVLQAIADNPDALADAKEEAMAGIAAMAKEMSAEATIEQLVKAKGFSQCVCIVSDNKASVVVDSKENLTAAQVAQILEIVYLETGILPSDTKVMASM
ncbi:MAG: SpoIIIAH-like family protein [Clostridia bacterium]|nr:SpoIIIAH-like family protein [Clostridia bacterium]MBQ7048017.1 SpoIIIAH-like family protein [Clostridia bacterium]